MSKNSRPVASRSILAHWRSLHAALIPHRRRGKEKCNRRFRAILNQLEDRTVLSPTVFTVTGYGDSPSDPHNSSSGNLRYCVALADANTANPDGSLIRFDPTVFSAPRTIALVGSGLILSNTAAPTAITGPSSSLTVSGGGPSSNFSVFTVKEGVTASISGLTIANGRSIEGGGGVLNYGTVTLTGDAFSGNSAFSYGGGVSNRGTMILTGSTFSGNSAAGGGGVSNEGTLTLDSSTFSGNSAGGQGGGIWNGGPITLTGSTFLGNSATEGGAVYNNYVMLLIGSTIVSNSTTFGGLGGGVDNAGSITMIGDTISGNSATYGGGIANSSTMTLTGVTLSSNSATYGGGGFNFEIGTMTLTGVTLSGNSATYGGGIHVNTGGVIVLNNSIVASSTGGAISGTVSGGHNLIGDAANAGGLVNGVNGNLVGVNPRLAPLGNYGGPTQTMPLLPGSPAIDAGSTALAVDAQGNPLTTDQRGLPRLVGTSVDIGAFESSGFTLAVAAGNNQSTTVGTAFSTALKVSITPKHAGDPVDGGVVTFTRPTAGASATLSPAGAVAIASGVASVAATANATAGGPYAVTAASAGAAPVAFSLTNIGKAEAPSLMVTMLNDVVDLYDNRTSLREALGYAATLSGSRAVTFASGLTGTINLATGLTIGSNVSVAGPGAASLTVSGGGPSSDFSVFTVNRGVTASITGMTIAHGHSSGNGGGINNSGDLGLSGVILADNAALWGGGVYNNFTTSTMAGVTFSGNSAQAGGGLFNDFSKSTLTDASFIGNSANSGGAIYTFDTLTLVDVTLNDNAAIDSGGGISNGGTVILTNVTLAQNRAQAQGGAVANNGVAMLTHVTMAMNTAADGGGIYNVPGRNVILNNSIVAGSTGGAISGAVGGRNNLIDDALHAGGLVDAVAGNLVGVSPLLAPLGDYGGATWTMPLLPGSPAIDAGSSALAVDDQGHPLTTDQRGLPRVLGTSVDIGAFESSGFTLAVAAGNNQSTTVGTAFSTALKVSITPKHAGDPVDGGVVTFTRPTAGASATLSPAGAVAIASGVASVAATANATSGGPYSVTSAAAGATTASFSLTNSSNSVLFLKADAATQGTWKGNYGADGSYLVADAVALPSYASVTATGNSSWTWAGSTPDARALQKSATGSTDRIAATWYQGTSFSVDVSLTDGKAHQVSLYAVDWDNRGRSERIDVVDATTGATLDSRTLSSFAGGVYLSWQVTGKVRFVVTRLAGDNAVVSAVFLGGASNPTTSAVFLKSDATTQGNWKDTYGTDGYGIVQDAATYPSYASVTATGNSSWTWAGSTSDARALQKSATGSTDRIAATWYQGTSFSVDVSLTDGKAHQVSLYAVDWDNRGRSERIDVVDATTGATLDSRTLSSFAGGVYLSWQVTGKVRFVVTRLAGDNAVLSGLFFGS